MLDNARVGPPWFFALGMVAIGVLSVAAYAVPLILFDWWRGRRWKRHRTRD